MKSSIPSFTVRSGHQSHARVCVCVRFACRALSSQQLTLASVMVVDTPGLRSPRHSAEERGASWSELCHNYLQEKLLEHYHAHTFTHTLDRYAQVNAQASTEPQLSLICLLFVSPCSYAVANSM